MDLSPLYVYLGIAIGLVVLVLLSRSFKVITGEKKSNEFPAWEKHGTGLYWRLNRAQANCIENLPIFASLMILGYLQHNQEVWFSYLGWAVIGGRVFQILSHLAGETVWHVNFRFTGYFIQVVSFVGMLILLVNK